MMMLAALCLSLLAAAGNGPRTHTSIRVITGPDHTLTPGETRPLTRTQVCTIRWGKDRRHVSERLRREVAALYQLPPERITVDARGREHYSWPSFEFDHLIPRELAGADSRWNISPQTWVHAHQKDRLENELHRRVCRGDLTLEFAQHAIAVNWLAAYRLYVR